MKAKVLRQFLNGDHVVVEGEIIDLPERRLKELERNKLVVPAEIRAPIVPPELSRVEVPPEQQGGAEAGAPGPITADRAGGLTGAERPASLSRRGRPRGSRNSAPRMGSRASLR